MAPNEHKKVLIGLMSQAGIVVKTTPAPHTVREGRNAAHYHINVYSTKYRCEVSYTNLYSMGWDHFKASDLPVIKPYGSYMNPSLNREEAFKLLATGRDDSPVVQDIRRHANNQHKPEPVQVFWLLLSDAVNTDQDFTDWADELGYSDDSIQAKKMWEECNNTRRFLESIIPNKTLAAMYDIASKI